MTGNIWNNASSFVTGSDGLSTTTEDGKEKVELLTAPWAEPGTIIQIEGAKYTGEKPAKIDIDHFCKIEYRVSSKCFTIAGQKALAAGKPVTTNKADNCEVC